MVEVRFIISWINSSYRWTQTQVADASRVIFVVWVFSKHCGKCLLPWPGSSRSFPELVRQAMEELGLTYLKLGQFLAMRFDILPPQLCSELSRLFENVAPMSFADAKRVLEADLQQPLKTLFVQFEVDPVAAASVGQVHIAKTRDGVKVAVKIQREGIATQFEADMRILGRLGRLADYFNLLGGVISAVDTVREFADWTRGELNFELEGQVAERLRVEVGAMAKVPQVFWGLTGKRVLTTEFIEGFTLARVLNIIEHRGVEYLYRQAPQLDLKIFGKNLVKTVLYQLFVSGFFHGDPHPGNLIVCGDNKVGLVDFGIFGELNQEQRDVLAQQIERISIGDIDGCFRCVAKQYYPSDDTDFAAFEAEAKKLMWQWYQASLNPLASLKEQHLGYHSGELLDVVRRHGLRGGTNTLLFWRSLYVLDATALKLRDHFNLFKEMDVFFTEIRPSLPTMLMELLRDRHYQYLPHHLTLAAGISPDSYRQVQQVDSRRNAEIHNRRIGVLVMPIVLSTATYLALVLPTLSLLSEIAGIAAVVAGIVCLWQSLRSRVRST